ncbi:MAG TPA: Na+/H+ antiporter NhaA [Vicinamibacterales bacterium]|nr:Na+/H+ antiporter NhaA [Vicinamibacterales bacterium]
MHSTTPPHSAALTPRHAHAPAALDRDAAPRGHVSHHPRPARMPGLWHFAVEHLLLLPVGAVIALVWVNTAPESYFRVTEMLRFAVNDLAMTLFFGLIAKEIIEATIPGGVLHPWRRAALPFAASVGLTLVPLALFAVVVPIFDEPRVRQGWPAVFASDVAFGYFAARLIFGRHAPVPFFVLLAIAANGLGLVALAFTGADASFYPAVAVGLMALSLTLASMLRQLRVRSLWAYLIGGGGLSWCALYFGGLEPAFALLPILPFVPHARRDPGFFVDAPPTAHDPLSRFEQIFRHPAQIALGLFGLVAAGVPLKALDWGTLSLPLSVLIGKPIGLLAGVAIARGFGLHLPSGIRWRELTVLGLIASAGFTVALFFATAAIGPGPTLSAIKMGALVSAAGVFVALIAARLLRTGRFAHPMP